MAWDWMAWGHVLYVGLGISPVGGTLASIPFGLVQMKYPAWLVIVTSPVLGYVQVVAVDWLWDLLSSRQAFQQLLQRKRSQRVERLMHSGGSFWVTLLAVPLMSPWMVMAFMRYAQV